MAIRIDTLVISKRLTDGGFTRDQADVLSATWNEAIDMAVSDLATREDLTRSIERSAAEHTASLDKAVIENRAALDKAITENKAALDKLVADQRAAIAEATNRQIVWTVATMLAAVGMVVAITRLL